MQVKGHHLLLFFIGLSSWCMGYENCEICRKKYKTHLRRLFFFFQPSYQYEVTKYMYTTNYKSWPKPTVTVIYSDTESDQSTVMCIHVVQYTDV